jgi:parallel beta-helix repeat protein
VIQAGVKVLFLANSDDQSSGQRLSDSELLVKGTLSATGTADAPVVLSSSNAVASAGDWGGIYLDQDADLTLTYAHLSYSGYGIKNNRSAIFALSVTNSRLEFSGGGISIDQRPGGETVITDNVISVGTSGDAIYWYGCCARDLPVLNISRNVITNTQGSGVAVYYAWQGLTIDANTISTKRGKGIDVRRSGGVIAITANTLENTDTDLYAYGGSGIEIYGPESTGGKDNAITSVTLQNNTLKKFGGEGALYFYGDNVTITSSITGNTITDSLLQGMYINSLQGTNITGNTITGSTNAGVYLENAVPSIFKDNTITGNGTASNQPGLYISHSNAELSESFLI